MTSLMSASKQPSSSLLAHSTPSQQLLQQFSTISQSGPLQASSSYSSSPLTSLLHQKLTTTNDSNSDSKQSLSSSSSMTQSNVNQKKVLNDIASGLANAVAVAVSNAVSSVHHQINNQQELSQNKQTITTNNFNNHQQQLQPYSQLRQQLETKEPNSFNKDREISANHIEQQQQHQSFGGNVILRKRLSNINIEAAVATAVNRYLTATIKNNQALTPATIERQLDRDENILSVNN